MRAIVCLALAALSVSVLAKDGADPFAVCHKDMERLCKEVRPGEGRIMKCMQDKQASLSAGCAALMAKKKEKTAKQQ